MTSGMLEEAEGASLEGAQNVLFFFPRVHLIGKYPCQCVLPQGTNDPLSASKPVKHGVPVTANQAGARLKIFLSLCFSLWTLCMAVSYAESTAHHSLSIRNQFEALITRLPQEK